MKTCMRLLCLSLTLLYITNWTSSASAQGPFSDRGYTPVGMRTLDFGFPGRVWIEANLAENGLGYEGSYGTIGAKRHIGQDYFDGRWLIEAQAHFSAENASTDNIGFFSNIGIERVFSLQAAGADISLGAWFDYDDDQQGAFAHTMTAYGVSGSIKTARWSLNANGYFPIGNSDYSQGLESCFLGNSIVLTPALDSALQGFDTVLTCHPEGLAAVNGTVGIGGYGYGSDLVDDFGGIRARFGFQPVQGAIINMEANHDDRFDFTGVIQLALLFGGSARGTEYGLTGRDLEPTLRNDHIVRFQQDLVLAIDPDTGRPYNVFHVDNTADPAFADGTFETRFVTLKQAEAASGLDDVIFVHEGDGTTRNMDQGIVLKEGQLLLGDGIQHLLPIQNGQLFVLCNNIDGILPTITNRFGGNAVDLSSRNTVRGFNIDGSQGGMNNAISGIGVGGALRDGTIEDVNVFGNPILNGILLDNIAGNWTFSRNDIQTASNDGIHIDNAADSTSRFRFDSNIVSNNARDGIHMEDYDGIFFNYLNNTTDGNGRDGVRMERFVNGAGTGVRFDLVNHGSDSNGGNGISIREADGDLRILNASITNNGGHGIELINFTNTNAADNTLIGTSTGTSTITGNGLGGGSGIRNDLNNGGTQRLTITNSTIDNNGRGIHSTSSGVGGFLTTSIIDNVSIDNNLGDGIRLGAFVGSTHIFTIENTVGTLSMSGNGSATGHGISLFSGDPSGTVALLQGDIRNVNITGTGGAATDSGIFVDTQLDGQFNVNASNVTITGSTGDGIHLEVDTNANGALNRFVGTGLNISGSGGDSLDVVSGTDTLLDIVISGSTLAGGSVFNVTGDHLVGSVDNRTRIDLRNNTMGALTINGFGDAHVLTNLDANTINGVVSMQASAVGLTPGSVFNVRMTNNLINAGAGSPGLDIDTIGASTVNLEMLGNSITGTGAESMNFTNSTTGSACLAMSNNSFVNTANVVNNNGAIFFTLELDGNSNGIGVPTLTGTFTLAPFGTVCSPAIAVEEAAFVAAGFPPLP